MAIKSPIVEIRGLSKTYPTSEANREPVEALKPVDLDIYEGEIFALLGPNGAGKTTLISVVCGITNPSDGEVRVEGWDIIKDYRKTRKRIGLVPQELVLEPFTRVRGALTFSRGLFGLGSDKEYEEKLLRELSLWDKRSTQIVALSGGMKRRVLIAKALAHKPKVLFLDEPTAGVDVELRKDMWALVRRLSAEGVTIILTTHYIEEAEEMADRVGIVNKGELLLVEEKQALMQKLGKKELHIDLRCAISQIPPTLSEYDLRLEDSGNTLVYCYDIQSERTGITALLSALSEQGLQLRDLSTRQSSLEDIFVDLVKEKAA